ncbi:MAG: hypothetical protein U5R31_00935 [Acidimicrobiia bacterium]|nr:hypothetical protein [Acidimicrobiia bacterium]
MTREPDIGEPDELHEHDVELVVELLRSTFPAGRSFEPQGEVAELLAGDTRRATPVGEGATAIALADRTAHADHATAARCGRWARSPARRPGRCCSVPRPLRRSPPVDSRRRARSTSPSSPVRRRRTRRPTQVRNVAGPPSRRGRWRSSPGPPSAPTSRRVPRVPTASRRPGPGRPRQRRSRTRTPGSPDEPGSGDNRPGDPARRAAPTTNRPTPAHLPGGGT